MRNNALAGAATSCGKPKSAASVRKKYRNAEVLFESRRALRLTDHPFHLCLPLPPPDPFPHDPRIHLFRHTYMAMCNLGEVFLNT